MNWLKFTHKILIFLLRFWSPFIRRFLPLVRLYLFFLILHAFLQHDVEIVESLVPSGKKRKSKHLKDVCYVEHVLKLFWGSFSQYVLVNDYMWRLAQNVKINVAPWLGMERLETPHLGSFCKGGTHLFSLTGLSTLPLKSVKYQLCSWVNWDKRAVTLDWCRIETRA